MHKFIVSFYRSPGRHLLEVSVEEVEYLGSLHFSWTKIAEIIGISRSTLYRRLYQEGIDQSVSYSTVRDRELDEILVRAKIGHPNDGEKLIIGHLRRIGSIIQRSRISEIISRVDPVGIALRRTRVINGRIYQVNGPNSFWYIDGHHKLINWCFVIHGAIDGFPRTVLYLHCSTNNLASTVMNSFYKAVSDYGLPNQIRSDLGGENIEVWWYIIEQEQSESAVLMGSSTHNQRIERLWQDTHRCVNVLYANLFKEMEADDRLYLLNEIDLFCLHVVFLPRINRDLDSFIECWNNHSLSTEGNLTPNKLFIQGALQNYVTINEATLNPSTDQYTIPSSNDAIDVP